MTQKRRILLVEATADGVTGWGEVSASERYWEDDLIEPAVEVTSRGTILAPDSVGIGYRVRRQLVKRLTVKKKIWAAEVVVGA